MFSALGPNAFYIHAVFNLFAVAIVFCFYPEVACRTLEEIDLLFASKSPFVWATEKRFRELKAQHAGLALGGEELRRKRLGEVMGEKEKGGVQMLEAAS